MQALVVPPELLLDFLYKATKELEDLTIIAADHDNVAVPSRGEIRTLLLQRQHDILSQVVEEFNSSNSNANDNNIDSKHKLTPTDVQNELKLFTSKTAAATDADNDDDDDDQEANKITATVQKASQDLNEAARLAYCRLVLFSGCLQELQRQHSQQQISSLKESGDGMSRDDILELCGLCTTVLRLPLVQQHLEEPGHGTPLFHAQLQQQELGIGAATGFTTSIFPHERLERIQRIFLQMMGYNADYGTAEIKRIFDNSSNDNDFTEDQQVMQVFHDMMTQIQIALNKATMKISESNFSSSYPSDYDQGGSTRIVAVNYSEHEIDAHTGQVIATIKDNGNGNGNLAAPKGQAMEDENADAAADRQRQEQQALRTAAVATARLQQEILAQVLSLPEEEREEELQKAKQVSERVVQQVLEIAPGPGRVEFFQSLDSDTQRLLALHKLWETHVTSKCKSKSNNNNNTEGPAKIRYAPGFAQE